jgi:tRNA threonylcarbamoyladenosine biosynthesis protein TsaE
MASGKKCGLAVLPIFSPMQINSYSVKDTLTIGRMISRYLRKGDIVCLFGKLGSGKTVLTKGISAGLGIKTSQVISPTFVLLREYAGRIPVYHFDLYRLNNPQEILSIGYEEFFYDEGISVIEWADKLGCLLPLEFLKIELKVKKGSSRLLKLNGIGSRYRELSRKIYENISH